MQSIVENIGFLGFAFGIAGLIWLIGTYYQYRGTSLLSQISRNQIDQPIGFGSWYARNITGNLQSVLYSIMNYISIPLTFLMIGLIVAPLEFNQLFEHIGPTIPFFAILGMVMGFDFRYRWWGTGKPEPMDATD